MLLVPPGYILPGVSKERNAFTSESSTGGPEDENNTIIRNVAKYLPDGKPKHPGTLESSATPL